MRLLVMMWLLLLLQPVPVSGAEPLSAREIIAQVQELLRAETSTARYAMTIVTPEWHRTLRFDAWDDRRHRRFLIRILEPRKERGVGWLKDGGNLWMYMPKLERDIRIPPSMMLSSWMGSDFTNDDLVKMESLVDDYEHHLIAQDDKGVTIESLPKPDAPVVWGKIIHRVGRDGLPVFSDYYDEHGTRVRRLAFLEPRMMGGRRIPTLWIVLPDAKPGHRTEMRIERVSFNVPIDPEIFTRANLRRGR